MMVVFLAFLFLYAVPVFSAPLSVQEIRQQVQAFKADPRGPYQGIRWFCPDGTVRGAQDRCPDGHQHALVKDVVQRLADENGIYLGQILTGTPFEAFWDSARAGSRLKQYQMEKFLQGVDQGWIVQKAQYYRGAVQAEDEEAWGRAFLTFMLSDPQRIQRQFLLLRQASLDIPHGAGNPQLRNIRALARTLGDSIQAFMPLRIKIHGQPDARDLDSLRAFRKRTSIAQHLHGLFDDLETMLVLEYEQSDVDVQRKLASGMGLDGWAHLFVVSVQNHHPEGIVRRGAELLWRIREEMPYVDANKRLQMMDWSLAVEASVFKAMGNWQANTPQDLLDKARALLRASVGGGYLEFWEYESLIAVLTTRTQAEPLSLFAERVIMVGRAVNWGTGMVRAIYDPVVALFVPFEPLAAGFVDDRVRGSVLLGLGQVAGQLADVLAYASGRGNHVMGLVSGQSSRGLNPGYARGELVVIKEVSHHMDFDSKKIYVIQQAPAEMKPVAGIATVSEGNAVSHVQLLARNLGIPNAVMSADLVDALMAFDGQDVFYAVSPRGMVMMKPALEMTADEQALFDHKRVLDERVLVPTDRMDLSDLDLPSLLEVRADDSGVICGPKAANLGELRSLFPQRVAPGMVIPFGVFRAHMDQAMPEMADSYWGFLQDTFVQAQNRLSSGEDERLVENGVLARLGQLREAIKTMPFLPWFSERLDRRFVSVFGDSMGQIPVFVRSDTNMEDLKDFTGAGLNLTVPNVKKRDVLLQAIRDVWASPFTERSYRWRQKFLQNPEQVYPSILLLRSVPVEKSGVMITTGVGGGSERDVTVAFSRGVGGAVEGQSAETVLLKQNGGQMLLSPARDLRYTVLPVNGGVSKALATFEKPVLENADRQALRLMAREIRLQLAGMPEPFDVELGILDGEICLFQVRPFVESKRVRASVYLNGLDPVIKRDAIVNLVLPLQAGHTD